MSQKKSAELLGKLKRMAAQAGEALFERAGLAIEVLADSQWIADTFEGDRARAEESISADCFPDLSMGGWFGKLLILRGSFTIDVWKQHKFNLARLWIEYQKGQEVTKPKVERIGPIPRKEHEEVKEELEATKYQLRKGKEHLLSLEERCHDLERENAELKGRISTLEMLLDRYAPKEAVA